VDFPADGAGPLLQAQAADHALDVAIGTALRHHLGRHPHLRRAVDRLALQRAQQHGVAGGLLQQGVADMALHPVTAGQLDQVAGLDLALRLDRLPVDEEGQRAQQHIGAEHDQGGDQRGQQIPQPRQRAHRRRAPQRRSGIQAAHIEPFLENDAAAEKANAGHHLRRDARAVGANRAFRRHPRQRDEGRRPGRH